MENNSTSADDLKIIRKIMEDSTRFLSLSGLAGLFAGIFAIAGAITADLLIRSDSPFLRTKLIIVALLVLCLSIVSALWFSGRRAKKAGSTLWTPVLRRLVINMMIPLATGGIFIIILMLHGNENLIAPGMLIFYGLALVNAGKFTFGEIFYLGLLQIFTGLIAAVFPGYGIWFWAFGFGILHIIYGIFMYRKYEA